MTVEENEAIRELIYRYCQYIDEGNSDGWASLFVEDGLLDLGLGAEPMVGRDALRAFCSGRKAGTSLHVSANHVISVEGDGATVESIVFVITGNDDPRVRLGGRYADQLRRDGGVWRIVDRRLDQQFRLPA